MKNMKKFFAVLLTIIMALGMMTTSLAATITVPDNKHTYEVLQIFTGDLSGDTLSNLKWGANAKDSTKIGEAVEDDVIAALEAIKDASDTEKLAVIEQYVNLNSNPVATLGAQSNPKALSQSGLANGYYLVRDKEGSVPTVDENNKPFAGAYTLYVVKIVKDVIITTKDSVPSVDKKIVEGSEKVNKNEASIGDDVKYEFTGTMPSRIADYNTYYYVFNDTLSAGLTLKTDEEGKNDIKVMVDGVDATEYFYISSNVNTDKTTTIKVGISDIKELNNVKDDNDEALFNITANTKVVVTYTAVLNEDALIAPLENPNEVDLTYSNNPNDSGEPSEDEPDGSEPTTTHPTGTTPKSEVKTYTTEVNILKTDENGKTLTGAEFEISGEGVNKVVVKTVTEFEEDATNGTYYKLNTTPATYTLEAPKGDVYEAGHSADDGCTDDKNHLKFKNNYADYADWDAEAKTITKMYAPKTVSKVTMEDTENTPVKAFVDNSGKVTFSGLGVGSYTIKETTTPAGYNTIPNITFDIDWTEAEGFTIKNAVNADFDGDQTFTTTIVNQSGSVLPETGGMGTTIFYVIGSLLVLGAGVILVTRRRVAR